MRLVYSPVLLYPTLFPAPPASDKSHVGEISGFKNQQGEASQAEVLRRHLEELCLPSVPMPRYPAGRMTLFPQGLGRETWNPAGLEPEAEGHAQRSQDVLSRQAGHCPCSALHTFCAFNSSSCRKVVACVLTSCPWV